MEPFQATVARLGRGRALMSFEEADISTSDDGKTLVITGSKSGEQLEIPVANFKKMSPPPRSAAATAFHLDVENMPAVAQLKLTFTCGERLRSAHSSLAKVIGIAEKNANRNLLDSPHLLRYTTASSPALRLARRRLTEALTLPENHSAKDVATMTDQGNGGDKECKKPHLDAIFEVVVSRLTANGQVIPPDNKQNNGNFTFLFENGSMVDVPTRNVVRLAPAESCPLVRNFFLLVKEMEEVVKMEMIFLDHQQMMVVFDFIGRIVGVESSPPIDARLG